jgi:hypothetical protein
MKFTKLLAIAVISILVACTPIGSPEEARETFQAEDLAPVTAVTTPVEKSPNSPVATLTKEAGATFQEGTPVEASAEPAPERGARMVEQTPLPGTEKLVAKAKEMLIQLPDFGFTADEISPVLIEAKQWRDSSLGCPREGMMYAQVITPGYMIVLQAGDRLYEFHTDRRETAVLCFINGEDALSVLQP